uniref:T9SS type A sorting domain-containing protein n=1 Tax=Salmonella sp. SAL04269 TaxID=3159847 RepID=UPI00397C5E62
PENSPATIIVSDQHGKAIKMIKKQVIKGMNRIQLNNLGHLSNGTYLLQVITNEGLKTKRVVKVGS